MSFKDIFNRREKIPPVVFQPPAESRIEVELHKSASEEAATKAKEVNQHLNDLLIENGITLKLYLAAGGKPKKREKK